MSAITAPKGFVAAGVHAGLKAEGKLDLSLIATADGQPVNAAAVFTSNKLAAAPVQVSRAHLAATAGRAAAVIVNSGNANAATGVAGYDHAVYGIPDPAWPILFEHPTGPLLVSTTKLSQFVTGRYAPARAWKSVWSMILLIVE